MQAYALKDDQEFLLSGPTFFRYITVQKEHLLFKLLQSAETVKASVIFSYL